MSARKQEPAPSPEDAPVPGCPTCHGTGEVVLAGKEQPCINCRSQTPLNTEEPAPACRCKTCPMHGKEPECPLAFSGPPPEPAPATMHEAHGEPDDALGKHTVCPECGACAECLRVDGQQDHRPSCSRFVPPPNPYPSAFLVSDGRAYDPAKIRAAVERITQPAICECGQPVVHNIDGKPYCAECAMHIEPDIMVASPKSFMIKYDFVTHVFTYSERNPKAEMTEAVIERTRALMAAGGHVLKVCDVEDMVELSFTTQDILDMIIQIVAEYKLSMSEIDSGAIADAIVDVVEKPRQEAKEKESGGDTE